MILHLQRAGLQTQIHDLGRPHHRHLGVPVGGALDRSAARTSNQLVGNPPERAVIEMTLWGPTLRFEGEGQIAITGADLQPRLDGEPVEMAATLAVHDGQVLAFGEPRRGCRAYLAVGGMWKVSSWLGSVSPAPIEPERLTPQSLLSAGSSVEVDSPPTMPPKRTMETMVDPDLPLRILPGPEGDDQLLAQLTGRSHVVTNQSNRMGCRLESQLQRAGQGGEMISSCVVPGTIQLMNGGQPVVLLADAQTIGGYPRIANVITADQDRLAQFKPGEAMRFTVVTAEVARKALLEYRNSANG